jgi:hypothetical protein
MPVKYAALAYDTENIGDEIQSLAAMQFLPRVDTFINREWLNAFNPSSDDEYVMIMNGWYCHLPEHWPPSDKIRPLLISIHLSDQKSESGRIPCNELLRETISAIL